MRDRNPLPYPNRRHLCAPQDASRQSVRRKKRRTRGKCRVVRRPKPGMSAKKQADAGSADNYQGLLCPGGKVLPCYIASFFPFRSAERHRTGGIGRRAAVPDHVRFQTIFSSVTDKFSVPLQTARAGAGRCRENPKRPSVPHLRWETGRQATPPKFGGCCFSGTDRYCRK